MKLAIILMQIGFWRTNNISITLLQINNFYVKWWHNQIDLTFGKIVLANKRYVWYAHFYKMEIAYEQFRNQ